jgi:hypothetical protein
VDVLPTLDTDVVVDCREQPEGVEVEVGDGGDLGPLDRSDPPTS